MIGETSLAIVLKSKKNSQNQAEIVVGNLMEKRER
jgi:hypothetical protein